MSKKIILVIIAFVSSIEVFSQLTIQECYQKATKTYPLIVRYDLLNKSKEYNLSNASKGYLPQFSLSAKATYQSEVTSFPIVVPGVDIPTLAKDQYNVALDFNQVIWDGGAIKSQKDAVNASYNANIKKNEVDLYALNDQINNLFFGILLLDEQLIQNNLYIAELQRNYTQIESYLNNGIANSADLDAVKVEQLGAIQQQVSLKSAKTAYQNMLSIMIGERVSENTILVKPEIVIPVDTTILRPELQYFEATLKQLDSKKSSIKSKVMPKFSLFAQGGYGRPGLNMLNNEFSPYFMGGVRLSWNIGGFYTKKNEYRDIEISRREIAVQKDVFLFNTSIQTVQQNQEIDKLTETMKEDDKIIDLRGNIKRAAEAKVANGTLSVTELVREINSEQLAIQNKTLHQMQLLMAIYKLKYITNN